MFDHIPDKYIEVSLKKNEIKFQDLSPDRRANNVFINIALEQDPKNFDFVLGPRIQDMKFVTECLKNHPKSYIFTDSVRNLVKDNAEIMKIVIQSLIEKEENEFHVFSDREYYYYSKLLENPTIGISESLKSDKEFVQWLVNYLIERKDSYPLEISMMTIETFPGWKKLGYMNNREFMLKILKIYPIFSEQIKSPLYKDVSFVKEFYSSLEENIKINREILKDKKRKRPMLRINLDLMFENQSLYENSEIVKIILNIFEKYWIDYDFNENEMIKFLDVVAKNDELMSDEKFAFDLFSVCNNNVYCLGYTTNMFTPLLLRNEKLGLTLLKNGWLQKESFDYFNNKD